jgi:hypothetical protein
LARLSSNTTQLIDPAATHDINFDDPDLIVKGIRIVLSKVHDHDAKQKQVLAGD